MKRSSQIGRHYLRAITTAAAVMATLIVATACVPTPAALPISGVVDHIDSKASIIVLDTIFGPLTATLGLGSKVARVAIPGDAPNTKQGPISLSDVQSGSNVSVMVPVSRLQQIVADAQKPSRASDALTNNITLLKRNFGLLDGYTVATNQVQVGPAPTSIEASDGDKLAIHAIPATFIAHNVDGTFTVLITEYGYITVYVGPGTRYDLLGRPISPTALKKGDNLLLYGAMVWEGIASLIFGDPNQSALPVSLHIASLHVVSVNEHTLSGKVITVTPATDNFRITSDEGESYTLTVGPSTSYQSLISGLSVSTLRQLKPGNHIVAYTIGDNDTAASIYLAWTIYSGP
jgi:hypothetical protein